MKHLLVILIGASLLFSACMPGKSLLLESARNLPPGAWEIQGSGSLYNGYRSDSDGAEWGLRSANAGLALRYGLKNDFNLQGRYEYYGLADRIEFFQGDGINTRRPMHYLEIAPRYGMASKKGPFYGALSISLGLSIHPTQTVFSIAPLAIATREWNNHFDLSLQTKLHLLLYDNIAQPDFTFGIGAGFSNNLQQWAIRPEISTNLFNVNFGLGYSRVFP
ncbi:MAG: hypothetical protein IPL65_16435 [Lewinellaceae bacterium]|nr:hypothetical protein [Lewinellaceae bacterium]